MSRIIRMISLIIFFSITIFPVIFVFLRDVVSPDIFQATSTFVSSISGFLQNVRGALNYFISYTFGTPAITAFNIMIYWSFFLPLVGLGARFANLIRRLIY